MLIATVLNCRKVSLFFSSLKEANLEIGTSWICTWRDSVTRFFASDFFHESPSSKSLKVIQGWSGIFSKFAEIFASQGAPPVSTTPVANLLLILLVLLIPVANLPPVSMTSVAICPRYQRHRWQIMRTISDCWRLKVKLEKKMYLYVDSNTQRCSHKKFKIFWLKIFSILPPVSTTPVVHHELRISPRIF